MSRIVRPLLQRPASTNWGTMAPGIYNQWSSGGPMQRGGAPTPGAQYQSGPGLGPPGVVGPSVRGAPGYPQPIGRNPPMIGPGARPPGMMPGDYGVGGGSSGLTSRFWDWLKDNPDIALAGADMVMGAWNDRKANKASEEAVSIAKKRSAETAELRKLMLSQLMEMMNEESGNASGPVQLRDPRNPY